MGGAASGIGLGRDRRRSMAAGGSEAAGRGSIAGFTILVTGAAVTASLLFLVVGVFVWMGFVHVPRWTTWIDRGFAGMAARARPRRRRRAAVMRPAQRDASGQ